MTFNSVDDADVFLVRGAKMASRVHPGDISNLGQRKKHSKWSRFNITALQILWWRRGRPSLHDKHDIELTG
jgi:hypothetical protein